MIVLNSESVTKEKWVCNDDDDERYMKCPRKIAQTVGGVCNEGFSSPIGAVGASGRCRLQCVSPVVTGIFETPLLRHGLMRTTGDYEGLQLLAPQHIVRLVDHVLSDYT